MPDVYSLGRAPEFLPRDVEASNLVCQILFRYVDARATLRRENTLRVS